jgi:lysophospholipase
MRPAAETFVPFFLHAGTKPGVSLRAARFAVENPRAICVLLNGQTEFIEKYFEVIDDLTGRGFSVATLDWRGQGGSERLAANPRKVHIDDFAHYDEDLDALMRQVVEPMTAERNLKVIALAHSMGGHILLRRLHDHAGEFAAVGLCAPMIGIQPRGVPWWVVRTLARLTPSKDFVWGMARRDQLTVPFAAQLVTSDPERYRRTHDRLAAHPDLRVNGPTWGWLEAALNAIKTLHGPGYAEAIATPALLVAASNDRVCDSQALYAFARRLPHATCLTIDGAEHEILMERDIYRDQLWRAFDAFMQEKAPRS